MANRFEDLLNAPAAERQRVARRLYDETKGRHVEAVARPPSKRRIKRIALYQRIIGPGHESILELGCGIGDLSYNLLKNGKRVLGTDISGKDVELAQMRSSFWGLEISDLRRIEFRQMSAVEMDLPDAEFDWAISTSMVEHLHPNDIDQHLREVCRVLRPGGSYLIWCPNGLGRHDDREGHLTMLSYRQWTDKLRCAGFHRFRSTLTTRPPIVNASWKILLETVLSRTQVPVMGEKRASPSDEIAARLPSCRGSTGTPQRVWPF
jgi:ubiquinone/menaquinone biosynthesis C-methylase UbiE